MECMAWFALDDELDELEGVGPGIGNIRTTTYLSKVCDSHASINMDYYLTPGKSIDPDRYSLAGLSDQSSYGSSLIVICVSGLPALTQVEKNIKQTGFFNCYLEDDATNGVVEFLGSWSVYSHYKSGHIPLNSIKRGVFSLKYNGRGKAY